MDNNLSWQDHVRLARHHHAIGNNYVSLKYELPVEDHPWEFVTKVDISAGAALDHFSFTASHPVGLTFLWSCYWDDHKLAEPSKAAWITRLRNLLSQEMVVQFDDLLRDILADLRTYRAERAKRLKETDSEIQWISTILGEPA